MIARRTRAAAALVLAGVLGACGSTPSPSSAGTSAASSLATAPVGTVVAPAGSPGSASTPTFDPASFGGPVVNPWFPLSPGTKLVYQGTEEGENAVDTVTVTTTPKVVAGVTAVVVHHELALNGDLSKESDDWYAQDRLGNVWLLGTATMEGGDPGESDEPGSTEGSWESGVDGAQPGIVMPANPQIGDAGLEELYSGKAEDRYVVLLTDTTVKVPAGTFSGVLLTAVWSRLAPDVLTEKAYVQGTGEIREADVAGGDDVLELVSVTRP